MDNIFKGSGGLKHRRALKAKKGTGIPASLGVRLGYVADIERATPEGQPSKRRSKRIPTSVRILRDNSWVRVPGDLSAGGMLLLLDGRVETPQLEVVIELPEGAGRWHTRATILRREQRGRRVAHHLRFENSDEVAGLAEVIDQALANGERRLDTL